MEEDKLSSKVVMRYRGSNCIFLVKEYQTLLHGWVLPRWKVMEGTDYESHADVPVPPPTQVGGLRVAGGAR